MLSTVRYGESGVVANVLTRGDGRRAFMASAGGKGGKGGKMAMLMPLSLIEFVATGVKKSAMPRLSQARFRRPFVRLQTDPTRRSVAMFVAELLCRATPQDVPDPGLFDFADSAISALDDDISGAYNFHLWFMMHLTQHLGIEPEAERRGLPIFDMEAGLWTDTYPPHAHTLDGRWADLWSGLMGMEIETLADVTMTRLERREMIERLCTYYSLHLPEFGVMKSQVVLGML